MPSAEQQEQSRVSEKFHVPNSDATFDSSRVEQEQLQISEKFRAADSDITFKSSDGVLFELHKLNLAVTASGFPEFRTSDEVVELSETSNVLELLFQFCYPQRHPDLELVEVEVLVSLAEAAEKYEVFPAMSVCNIRMRENISQRPFDVMLYAAKHNYTDTLEAAYKLVLKEPLDEIITKLPPRLVIPWVLHYEQYARILRKSIAQYEKWAPGRVNGKKRPAMIEKKHQSNCRLSNSTCCLGCHILQNLGKGVGVLFELDTLFDPCCDRYPAGLISWRQALEEDIKQIPPFHTLL